MLYCGEIHLSLQGQSAEQHENETQKKAQDLGHPAVLFISFV